MKHYQPYPPEEYPDNIIYIENNFSNRFALTEHFGKPEFVWDELLKGYIQFNTVNNTWMPTPVFASLYRNTPPLTSISEVIKNHKK